MAWLTGWEYRRSVTASRSSGAVTNYAMKVAVGESSGASGYDVHCAGHCRSDFADLRFTKADETTLLDYWIESVSGTSPNQTATVWVELDSIGTSATTFYLYYGKSDASSAANGDNTFLFFDDFSGSYPGSKWSGDTSKGSVSGGILTFTNAASGEGRIYSAAQSGDIAFRSRAKLGASNYACLGLALADISQFIIVNYNSAKPNYSDFQRTAGTISNDALGFGSYQIYDIMRTTSGTPTIRGFKNGVQLGSDTTSSVPTNDFPAMVRHYNPGTVEVDWILIRPYKIPEPSWGSWGSEETNTITVNADALPLVVTLQAASVSTFLDSNLIGIAGARAAKPRFVAIGAAPDAGSAAAKPRIFVTTLEV